MHGQPRQEEAVCSAGREEDGMDGGRCPACDGVKGDELPLTGLVYIEL